MADKGIRRRAPRKKGPSENCSTGRAPKAAAPDEGQPATERSSEKESSASAASVASDARAAQHGSLYYVGIGASAGGLEALRPFVTNLPAHANMTYIIAQHMSPDHRSLMDELLAREARLQVLEASDNLMPKADTIYVAPPNSDITVFKGRLRISKPSRAIGPKPSVDRFFMSLAEDQEDRAIGIILSGTGSDGSHGIKAIKAAGGICIAQEPKSAKYSSMPIAAMRAGGTDLVLPPQEIADQLLSIVQFPRTPIVDDADESPPSTLRGIVRQISTHTGLDFSNYKDTTISRQIMRRMAAIRIPDLEAYGEYISKHHAELSELAGNFLICVTSFFRDPESFEAMRRSLREVLRSKQPGDDIRIWIPGCATGEEVYSVAIILAEELGEHRDKYRIQLFATDINGDAVSTARAGVYPEASLSGVASDLIDRYFTFQDGMYLIDRSLRDMTLFARQDLVMDPPFVRLDMVSCRNLLIYFKADLQERVMKLFHYALRNNGILFLGKSESVGRLGSLFIEKDRKNKVFIKSPVASPVLGSFSRMRGGVSGGLSQFQDKVVAPTNSALGRDRLFELYTPASLLMTHDGDILEIFGDCSAFLVVKKGKADFNAFTLIQPAFRAELRAFAHRVVRTGQTAVSRSIELAVAGKSQHYRMAVHGVRHLEADTPVLLLVSFEPCNEHESLAGVGEADGIASGERVSELEREIVLTRENLQTVIEELETANEELQSLNEEAQAGNEELQASNEELETANEELQASNEELITVNDELGTRSAELGEMNSDLSNILNSLDQGLLVVDGNLMITRHNAIALEFFDISLGETPSLASVTTVVQVPDLLSQVGVVVKTRKFREFEFKGGSNRYFLMRLSPYIALDRKDPGGVVITILDITEKKVAEESLRLAASVFEHASEAMIITDAQNQVISINPAYTNVTGYSADEVMGQNPRFNKSGKHPLVFYQHLWQSLYATGRWEGEIENRRKNGEIYPGYLSLHTLKDETGATIRHIGVLRDISEAKKAQETIERQAAFDILTGLANRNLIMSALQQMLATSRRNNDISAVLFIDLDRFKSINDALGHAAGDELLVKVALRLKNALRISDTVGRLGGDEFIVLLSELSRTDEVVPIAEKLLAEVSQPLEIADGHAVQPSVSIGITVYPLDGDTPEIMIKNADSALREAKSNGRNTFCFFTDRMQDEANRRHWIDSELGMALQSESMHVYYQPMIRIDTMTLTGAEALLRWDHPNRGFIPPRRLYSGRRAQWHDQQVEPVGCRNRHCGLGAVDPRNRFAAIAGLQSFRGAIRVS